MAETIRPALCVIGAGIAGTQLAMAAARNGIETVLIEKSRMGGQSLHTGCVPSKALIASAQRAYDMQTPRDLGISPAVPLIDYTALNRHIGSVTSALAQNVTPQRMEGLGIKVIAAAARFSDDQTVEAGDYIIKAEHYVIATGSAPAAPAVHGLNSVPYHTTDTVFSVTTRLESLMILGGTPYAAELAQAYGRLGSKVQLIEPGAFLPGHDLEAANIVRETFAEENIEVVEGAVVEHIERSPNLGVKLTVRLADSKQNHEASELLLAVGRVSNVDAMDLEIAGVNFDQHGIFVNKSLQTSNKRIFAIGDVLGNQLSASAAIAQAHAIVQRLISRIAINFVPEQVPEILHTDPQIAHIGLTEDLARDKFGNVEVRRFPLAEVATAQISRRPAGFAKVIVRSSGRIVGATIVGRNAGELIAPWSLAMQSNLTVDAVAASPMPYPSGNQATAQIADSLNAGPLRNPWLRKTLNKLPGVR